MADIVFPFGTAPSPSSAIRYLATKCINRHRAGGWLMPWGSNQCQQVHSFDEPLAKVLDANDIVFSVHIPHPNKEMSPWFQYLLVVLQLDIAFKMINQIGKMCVFVRRFSLMHAAYNNAVSLFAEDDAVITLDAGLAYRDNLVSEWTRRIHSLEQRPLRCIFEVPKVRLLLLRAKRLNLSE